MLYSFSDCPTSIALWQPQIRRYDGIVATRQERQAGLEAPVIAESRSPTVSGQLRIFWHQGPYKELYTRVLLPRA